MKLRLVHFNAPIPVCGTHKREQIFAASDGYRIDRDEAGDIHISGNGVDFVTDGFVSWVVEPEAPEPVTVSWAEGAPAVPIERYAQAGKRGRKR